MTHDDAQKAIGDAATARLAAAVAARPRHMIAVDRLDLADQADRLEEAHSLLYRLRHVFRQITYGDMDADVVCSIAALAEIAVENMAEGDMERASVFARDMVDQCTDGTEFVSVPRGGKVNA